MKSVVSGRQAGAHRLDHLISCLLSFAGVGRICCHRRPSPVRVSALAFGLQGLTETCRDLLLNIIDRPKEDPSCDRECFIVNDPFWDLAISSSVVTPRVLWLMVGTGNGSVGFRRSGEGVEGVMIGAPGTLPVIGCAFVRDGDSGSWCDIPTGVDASC